MALHLDSETVEPYALAREDRALPGTAAGLPTPKPRLIANKETGVIEIDAVTTLRGVPASAWDYRLGT